MKACACGLLPIALIAVSPTLAHAQCRIGAFDPVLGEDIFEFEAEGDLVYIPSRQSGLVIIDLSDPGNPIELSRFASAGEAIYVDVVGSLAYLITPEGLSVLDVSDPADPVSIGTLGMPVEHSVVTVSGSVALVSGRNTGLVAIDISDPSQPVQFGELADGSGDHIAVDGEIAYITRLSRLKVVDVSDPSAMVLLSNFLPIFENRGMFMSDVAVNGNSIYVVGGDSRASNGICAIDVSDPASPVVLDRVAPALRLPHLVLRNGVVYAPDSRLGALLAFDIGTPQSIRFLGADRLVSEGGLCLRFVGNTLVVSNQSGGLEFFTIGEGCGPCPGDVNGDNSLDATDFDAWLTTYESRSVLADQNLDLELTPADFSAWIANFNAGCD